MIEMPTVLEIDSKAVKANIEYFRSKLHPETGLLVVIKAFSYGSDAVAIARLLEELKVDYLAVSYTSEGIDLRNAGIKMPIMVLHPQTACFREIIKRNLEPALYSQSTLLAFCRLLTEENRLKYPVHIKCNTGMNRLGFRENEMDSLIRLLKTYENALEVRTIFSHLTSSEDKSEREFTLHQVDLFKRMSQTITAELPNKPRLHIANTAGMLNYPGAHLDLVRVGIGLYGFGNSPKETAKLRNVLTLRTRISQIQVVPAGETVGYNRTFETNKESRIAILPIGYADGMKRIWSNGRAEVSIHGKKAPVAGKICMCITMVDVTGIDCEEGDEVIIFNSQADVLALAKLAETIPYEILTSISQRVRRKVLE